LLFFDPKIVEQFVTRRIVGQEEMESLLENNVDCVVRTQNESSNLPICSDPFFREEQIGKKKANFALKRTKIRANRQIGKKFAFLL
jgi:hypothetical protein